MTTNKTTYIEDLDDYTQLAPDAFDASIGKTVPLKDGLGGSVIGTATLLGRNTDGTLSFEAQLDD